MGEPQEVAARLSAAHYRVGWKSVLLAVVPALGVVLPVASRMVPRAHWWLIEIFYVVFSLFIIAGTAREFLRDRRPFWLAAWSGVSLGGIMGIASLISTMGKIDRPYEVLQALAYVIPASAAAIWSWRGNRKWIAVSAVVSVILLLSNILAVGRAENNQFYLYIGLLASQTLFVLLALGAFGRHRYGNAVLASLFLFSMNMATQLIKTVTATLMYRALLQNLLAAVTIIVFARATTWQSKFVILAVGVFAIRGSWFVVSHYHGLAMATTELEMATMNALVVLAPMIIDQWKRRKQRMEYAS
jgi:hypothetical protein